MATDNARYTVSFPEHISREIDRLKKKEFYNQPRSELIRYLVQLGIQASEESAQTTTDKTA